MKLKLSFLAFTMVVAMQVVASPTVQNVTAKQRFPWNGLVDIKCKVTGIEKSAPYKFYIEAVQPDEGITNKVAQFWVLQNGTKQSNFKVTVNDDYHLIWDAKADLGSIRCEKMIVNVVVQDYYDKVQLWEGGPYWATTNIGSEKPEDYGYYFQWGDTVGYKRVDGKWVASDGSNSNSSLSGGIASTPSVLAPEQDAANIHWGDGWRMPTNAEFETLNKNCDWTWTTKNGIKGYIVKGRGAYASNSIFLPAAGRGSGTSLEFVGSSGYYWSSVSGWMSGYDLNVLAFGLILGSNSHYTNILHRIFGLTIRPVLGFTK